MKQKVSAMIGIILYVYIFANILNPDTTAQTGDVNIATESEMPMQALVEHVDAYTVTKSVTLTERAESFSETVVELKEDVANEVSCSESPEVVSNTDETVVELKEDVANEVSCSESPEVVSNTDETVVDEHDLWLLSHLIYAEAGCTLLEDKTRYYVGSVVLNRVNSSLFKDQNTIEEVIFADGQYECTWIGTFYNEPTERCIEIAKDLLISGSVLPENVVFQAAFKQGDGVYEKLDGLYFCYKN